MSAEEMAGLTINQIIGIAQQSPDKLSSWTCDGSFTNTAAYELMKCVFRLCKHFICLSHSANIPVKKLDLTCPTAKKFMSKYSNALNWSVQLRRHVRQLIGENPEQLSGIRWMVNYKVAVQLNSNYAGFERIIREEDFGCPELVESMLKILNEQSDTLQLELALIVDTAEQSAMFCYNYEGDGPLAFTAYDAWKMAENQLSRVIGTGQNHPVVPSVQRVAQLIAPNDINEQRRLIQITVDKARPVLDKMEEDTETRLRDTLNQLRGCRMADFGFIKNNTLEALNIEIHQVQFLPWAVPLFNGLKSELNAFKLIADKCDITMDRWEFWRTYYISLPIWYKVAEEVVLVMVSSASVERVFSLLNHSFDDHQQSALQDYKEATVRLRYNENWRTRYD
jgi:hypothetical protein